MHKTGFQSTPRLKHSHAIMIYKGSKLMKLVGVDTLVLSLICF
jgi:hypothetical protein